jgi:hypothetical protein
MGIKLLMAMEEWASLANGGDWAGERFHIGLVLHQILNCTVSSGEVGGLHSRGLERHPVCCSTSLFT